MANNEENFEIEGIIDEELSLPEFVEMIRDNIYTKQLGIKNGNPRVRVMNLWGISEPGIGKTQMIQRVAEEMGAVYKYIPGANVFQGDLSGIPSIYTPEGKVKPEAIKVMINHYFPQVPTNEKELNDPEMEYNKPGFLFVDEIMNMDPLVRGELLAYVDGNSKSVDGKEVDNFPPSWFIVAASNTEATVGDSFVDLAANIRAKFNTYLLYPTYESFLQYMQEYNDKTFNIKGFHPAIMSFFIEKENKNGSKASGPDKYPLLAPHFNPKIDRNVASPRNWEALNVVMRVDEQKLLSGMGKPIEIQERFEKKVLTTLGKKVGEQFLEYYQFEKDTIDPKDFISTDLSKSTKWSAFNKKSVQIRLMSMYRGLDYLDGLEAEDKKKNFKKYIKQIQDNVVWIIKDRGEEFLVGFLDSLIARFPELELNDLTPEFNRIAKKSIRFSED